MKSLLNFFANPRLIISSFCVAAIAMNFWLGSRYPSLGSKGEAGGNMEMDSALGFHALLSMNFSDNLFVHILVNAVNWMDNNKRGMLFGILFAAAILTLISLWKQRRSKGRFGGMLLGFGIGAPLGVCVNCATPVSQGLHKSGMRLETTLTALFSSPTFNVIVLSILFSLFPFYLALLKVVFTCLFIFVLLPIIIRWSESFIEDKHVDIDKMINSQEDAACLLEDTIQYGWLDSLKWFCINYLKNLWFVIKVSVPWMIFSGLLGATIITLVPWSEFTAWLNGLNQWQHFIGLLVTSVFGLFLPAPIAFDIILPSSLLDQGLLPLYTGTLLFSLGIFSVYPFIIIGRYISWKLSIILSVTLILLSMGMGVASGYLGKLDQIKSQALFDEVASLNSVPSVVNNQSISDGLSDIESRILNGIKYLPWVGDTPDNIKVESSHFQSKTKALPSSGFQQKNNDDMGFSSEMPGDPASAYQFFLPPAYSRGLAASDIQNDGWIDVVRATSHGLEVYLNDGTGRFYLLDIGIQRIDDMHVLAVAAIDINNDLYTDLVFTTLSHGNYILYNQQGDFSESSLTKLPNQEAAIYTVAIAFADFDKDGQTEIVLGNHWLDSKYANEHTSKIGAETDHEMDRAKNAILRFKNNKWEVTTLPGHPGATLTLLATDFDNDNDIDLLVGNDFVWPNTVYSNMGNGEFKEIKARDKIIPISTRSTMSIDSVDFDNDLDLDQFWAQVTNTGDSIYSGEGLRLKEKGTLCQAYADSSWYQQCESMMVVNKHAAQRRIVSACNGIEVKSNYDKCISSVLFWTSIRTEDRDQCLSVLPESLKSSDYICNIRNERDVHTRKKVRKDNTLKILRAREHTNIFLESKEGSLEQSNDARGLSLTGWSWSAKFADFDNDEWQDVYVVNGFFPRKARESNYFLRNVRGEKFIDETLSMGLEEYLATGSSVYADFDNDGDLDILTSPFFAPLSYFENNTASNQSVSFELIDQVGNIAGIGSKVIINYNNGSKSQLREVKSSGGYQSFNPPIATFGVGQHNVVDSLKIIWSTGEKTIINGPIKTGAQYRVYRSGN